MPTPNATKAPDYDRIEQLFGSEESFDSAWPRETQAQLKEAFALSADAKADRQMLANSVFLSARFRQPLSAIAGNYDAYRDAYSRQVFHVEQLDEGAFHSQVAGQLKKEHSERDMLTATQHSLYEGFVAGTPVESVFAHARTSMGTHPGYDAKNLDLYEQSFRTRYAWLQDHAKELQPAVDAVREYLAYQTPGTEAGLPSDVQKGKPSITKEAVTSELLPYDESDRQFIISLAQRGLKPSTEGEGEGTVRKVVRKTLTRAGRGVENFVKEVRSAWDEVNVQLDRMAPLAGADKQVSEFGEGMARRQRERDRVGAQLDGVIQGKLDPVKMNNWAGDSVLATAEFMPRLMAMFSGPGIALNFAATQAQLQDHYSAQGISQDKAAGLATIAAVPQTALMFLTKNMVTGKIPGFDRWAAGLSSRIARVGIAGGTEAGVFAGSVTAQDFMAQGVQLIGHTIDESIPSPDLKAWFEQYKQTAPRAFLEMAPLMLFGTGVAVFKSERFAREYMSDWTRFEAMGYPPEDSMAMAEAHSSTEKLALMEAAEEKRNPQAETAQKAQAQLGGEMIPFGTPEAPGAAEKPPGKALPADIEFLYEQNGVRYYQTEKTPENPRGRTVDGPTLRAEGFDTSTLEPPAGPKLSVTTNPDGTFTIKDTDGKPVAQAQTPEMAAKLLDDLMGSPAQKAAEETKNLGAGKKPSKLKQAVAEGQKLGFATGFGPVDNLLTSINQEAKEVWRFIQGKTRYVGFKGIVNEWMGNRQIASMQLLPWVKEIMRVAPSRKVRIGIANWLDAGGDRGKLEAQAKGTSMLHLKEGYEAALNLTPQELALAQRIRTYFDAMFEKARKAEVMDDEDFRQQYVTQLVDLPYVGGGVRSTFYGKLAQSFQFSQERTFPNFFELEQAGFGVRSKDIAEIVAVYDTALNKSINTRRMVKRLLAETDQDGPLALRSQKGKDLPEDLTMNYESIDHPTLRGMALREDIASHLRNILGRSAFKEWYDQPGSPVLQIAKRLLKFADQSNRWFANSMLSGLSTFHAVHEAKRFAPYLAGKGGFRLLDLNKLDPSDPELQYHVRHGLMVGGDAEAMRLFQEGFGHQSPINRLPIARHIQEFTFHELIPRLKFAAQKILFARNLERFALEIQRGELTRDDVAYITSHTVNARFGHQNYVDMGRNPTMQHLAQMLTLAPDFWESNIRNYGQVLQGLLGTKTAREPLRAFAVTAGAMWLGSRALNMALNDDRNPHFEEPFAVVAGGRVYTMRNEAEDLWRAFKGTKATLERGGRNIYVSGRLSPMAGSLADLITGSNWRGERVTPRTVVGDFLAKVFPLSLRWIWPVNKIIAKLSSTQRDRNISAFQEFLSTQGVQVSRKSVLGDAFKLAHAWSAKEGKPMEQGVYPVSKYQQLRYALEDEKLENAQKEIDALKAGGMSDDQIVKGLRASLLRKWTSDDEAFMESLSDEDQLVVATAEMERQKMYDEAAALLDKQPEEAKRVISEAKEKRKALRGKRNTFTLRTP